METGPRLIELATAKRMIREHLNADFPGVEFQVRSSRLPPGPPCVDVEWSGGPSEGSVRGITDLYSGLEYDVLDDVVATVRFVLNGRAVHPSKGAEPVQFDCIVFARRTLETDAAQSR